ncbi:MAG TPA: hypothetical protein VKY74_23760 [Chloroflexia bacterium]|nr:hypothetical protein [Chloroflexia bacterium]
MPFGLSKKQKKPPIDAAAPDGPGQTTLPNPGEYPPDGQARGIPLNSLGVIPATGARAGGNPAKPGDPAYLDAGARVGYLRNLEFSAGGRSQLVATGTSSPVRPNLSTRPDQTAAGAGAQPHPGDPPAQPETPTT